MHEPRDLDCARHRRGQHWQLNWLLGFLLPLTKMGSGEVDLQEEVTMLLQRLLEAKDPSKRD